MRTSSAAPKRSPLDRPKAWSCLVSNLLVLPGMGSVMAGRRAGYVQILLGLAGFTLTLIAAARFVLAWSQEFVLPNDPGLYRMAIAGIAIFLVAWFWSLLTSLALFRGL